MEYLKYNTFLKTNHLINRIIRIPIRKTLMIIGRGNDRRISAEYLLGMNWYFVTGYVSVGMGAIYITRFSSRWNVLPLF
jgi:hypothetical protein